jgi:site-specific recombinase XerD
MLAVPDLSCWSGRRDHVLLLTLYNTGARVSEIATMRRSQVQCGGSSFVCLKGKGRKERTVPLWKKTARALQNWFNEIHDIPGDLAFPSARGAMLSRHGVTYILDRIVQRAAVHCPSLKSKSVSPHVIRHSTAMHLLQSGVDTSVIALWLGHESAETTHIYVEADLATKERALENLAPPGSKFRRFRADDALIGFLASL